MVRVLTVLVTLLASIYGRYTNGPDAIGAALSGLASTSVVDGSPCDMMFLPDDAGNQRTMRVLEILADASQVLGGILSYISVWLQQQ